MSDLLVALSKAFATPEHAPLTWRGGQPTYLLIHGFLGTPAEWRPLAEQLHGRGAAVIAPLLPGFGERLAELPAMTLDSWLQHLEEIALTIPDPRALVIVGFSFGGTLAIHLAARLQPATLVLLAPFSRLPLPRIYQVLLPLLKRVSSGPQPFARINFEDPILQETLVRWNPLLDLQNPVIRAQLRSLRVPWRLVHQLGQAAALARKRARAISTRVIIVHGQNDSTVPVRDSYHLAKYFPTPPLIYTLKGDHQLIRPEHPAFPFVCQVLLELQGEYQL